MPYWSSYGKTTVHLGAPGAEILSTTIGDTYSTSSGTSMAAPHVAGVAALLKAQDPSRDWRVIKNLILAGGDSIPSLENTITRKRLNAYGSLTCFNSIILSRLSPVGNTINGAIGGVIGLSAVHINCATPNGEVTVVVNPGGQAVTLKDDGLGTDQAAGDGVYSGQWAPPAGGTFTLTFPNGDVVTVQTEPDLEPGFPVKAFFGPGSYYGNPAITLVGNIDDDPKLEIVVTGLAGGPLYAWHADGSPVKGWPIEQFSGAGYAAMGNLSGDANSLSVFAGFFAISWGQMAALSGSGEVLPGWPRYVSINVTSPPALADINDDGLDEIFISENDSSLHAYSADGSILPGWPDSQVILGQNRGSPAIADLDGDGDLEIVTGSGDGSSAGLVVTHHDGKLVAGFPIEIPLHVRNYPVIGDVDGDGNPEIVVVGGGVIHYFL